MKIKNRPSNTTQNPLHLSAAQDEDDELIQAIDTDHKGVDDAWELKNEPDVAGIDNFWNTVSTDLQNDPDWYSFSND